MGAARELDAVESGGANPRREAERAISHSQPMAGPWLRMLPTAPAKRIATAKFTWELQRRMGLHVTGPAAEVAAMLRKEGVAVDCLGDYFTTKADRKAPHDAALRVWHDMAQASATAPVVMGDKEHPEDYASFNVGHVLDLGEQRMGKGGRDRVIELKVYDPNGHPGSHAETARRGDTHAFGSTEERLIVTNRGVQGRPGERRWVNATGTGAVRAKTGCYDDAIRVKHNEFWLVIHETSGGLNREGVKLFHLYTLRARRGPDRTDYVASDAGARKFAPHWAQLLSAAIVEANGARALEAVDKERARLLNARLNTRAAAQFTARRARAPARAAA